jgi:AcrR family transcriptional regulator
MSSAEPEIATKILTAAAELFGERGYKGTTTRALAERAGVNEVTIFRYFGNKQGVLKALGAFWASNFAGLAVDELSGTSDTASMLVRLAQIETAWARQSGAVAMRLALDRKTSPEVAEAMGEGGPEDNFLGLVAYLAKQQDAGDLRADLDPRVMAEVFFALTSSLAMSRQLLSDGRITYDMPEEEVGRQVLELYLTGVGPNRRKQ